MANQLTKKLQKKLAEVLEKEVKKLEKHISELKQSDPFADPEHTTDNAAVDTDVREQVGHDTIEAEVKDLQKKLTDSRRVLNEINTKVQNLSLGKQNYDQLDPVIKNKINSIIPNNITFNSLVSSLEQTARTNEATISALQIQPLVAVTKTSDVGTLSEIDFTFNVEGNYQNIVSLLQELKRSDRLISIERVALSKLEAGQGILMSISGKAYFLK